MTVELEIAEDPGRACAAMLLGAVAGGGDVVLTGGSTPGTAYTALVQAVTTVGVDLSDTTLWFSDERCVPPDDERSNYLMVKRSLLDPLGEGNQPTVKRMEGELGPAQAADAYDRELTDAGPPRFDLVLLGMGADGHLASLFPDQPSLREGSRLVVGVEEAGLEPFVPRVSMTFHALAATDIVVFLITGAGKAEAVAAAFGPDARPNPHVPSSLLPPLAENVKVLLDPAAASRL
jgi:6-phosphogluconolactonase